MVRLGSFGISIIVSHVGSRLDHDRILKRVEKIIKMEASISILGGGGWSDLDKLYFRFTNYLCYAIIFSSSKNLSRNWTDLEETSSEKEAKEEEGNDII